MKAFVDNGEKDGEKKAYVLFRNSRIFKICCACFAEANKEGNETLKERWAGGKDSNWITRFFFLGLWRDRGLR
jgi:hypothetical protein